MKIFPVSNKKDTKRHIILASAGGIAWSTKEVYDTYQDINDAKIRQKLAEINDFYVPNEKSFINSEKSRLYGVALDQVHKQNLLLENASKEVSLNKDATELIKEANSVHIPTSEEIAKEATELAKMKREQLIKKRKSDFEKNIKDIKSGAASRTVAKFAGGAIIGLALSYLIICFKNFKNKNKSI